MLLGNMYIKFGDILRCAASAGIFLIWWEQPFGAVQLFRHTIHTAKGTTLPKGCFHIEVCLISLILPFTARDLVQKWVWEKGFNFVLQHSMDKIGNRLWHLPL